MSKTKQDAILLVDSRKGSTPLKLLESVEGTPTGDYTNGVLCTLEGPLADYSEPTRNNRLYEEDLWEMVLQSEYFEEMMATNTLFGEPDHPMEVESRDMVHLPYVSHAIRDVRMDKANKVVMGKLDILDTPYGRIIKTLVDYGAILGVSSRGNGNVQTTSRGSVVDPDSYVFITWDIVAYQSNKKARQTKVNESMNSKSLYESLVPQVEMMLDANSSKLESLKLTKSLISNSGLSDKNDLLIYINESIETLTNEDVEDSSQDAEVDDMPITTSEGTDDDEASDNDLLQEALGKILELREEIESCEDRIQQLATMVITRDDTITEKDKTIEVLDSKVSSLMDNLSRMIRGNEVASSSMELDPIEMMSSMDISEEISKNVNESLHKVVEALSLHVISENDKLQSSLVKSFKTQISKVLRESTSASKSQVSANEVLRENEKLTESLLEYEQASTNFGSSYLGMKDAYLQLRCSHFGIDKKLVESKLDSGTTYSADELDKVIRSIYSKNPHKSSGSSEVLNEASPSKVFVVADDKKSYNGTSDEISSIIRSMNK